MKQESILVFYLSLWIPLIGFILYNQWKKKAYGVGLVFAYLFHLWLIHWVGAFVSALPWYSTAGYSFTELGFRQCTFGLVGLVVGNVIIAPYLLRGSHVPESSKIHQSVTWAKIPIVYLLIGLFFSYVFGPFFGHLPTLRALVGVGGQFFIVALCLFSLKAWLMGRNGQLKAWLVLGFCMPFLTIIKSGYLGFGIFSLLPVLTFVASFFRPRWKIFLAALVVGYLGLSLYVSYMRDRDEIRQVVWGGESFKNRTEQLYKTISNFEWFNLYDEVHLDRIAGRLNQNYLVGAAVSYMSSNFKDYAYGGTIWEAVQALIPRALWAEKPMSVGGSNMVSEYTGIAFAEGTSVGVGHVLEFYINFGTIGVFFGFLIFGVIITLFDFYAARCLLQGNWKDFSLFYLPGLAFLQVGGYFVELSMSAGAAFTVAFLINKFIFPHSSVKEVASFERKGSSLLTYRE